MMFAQAEEMHADLIGKDALFHHVAQHGVMRFQRAIRAKRGVAKGVEAKFNLHRGNSGNSCYDTVFREKRTGCQALSRT